MVYWQVSGLAAEPLSLPAVCVSDVCATTKPLIEGLFPWQIRVKGGYGKSILAAGHCHVSELLLSFLPGANPRK